MAMSSSNNNNNEKAFKSSVRQCSNGVRVRLGINLSSFVGCALSHDDLSLHSAETTMTSHLDEDDYCKNYSSLLDCLRHNDPNVTAVDRDISSSYPRFFPEGYGIDFGDVLPQNTRVSALLINCEDVLPEDVHSTDCVQPLVNYVQTSPLLRKVTMTSWFNLAGDPIRYPRATAVAGSFVKAVANNRSIEALHLEVLPAPLDLQYLLSTTNSIKTLDLHPDLESVRAPTDEEEDMIAAAFGMNRTIENLTFGWALLPSLVEKIIAQLQSRPWGLNELLLNRPEPDDDIYSLTYADELCNLLHSTPRLQHLHLENYTIEENEMRHLVEGLLHRDGDSVPTVMLSKLSFDACDIEEDAMNVLIEFMQTKVLNEDKSVAVNSQLRELVIDDHRNVDDMVEGNGLASGLCIVAMLAMQPEGNASMEANPTLHATIGSQLHALTISLEANLLVDVFECMAAQASQLQLSQLNLKSVEEQKCAGLVKYLSSTLSLRELNIQSSRVDPRHVLKGLRENQSLYRVSVMNSVFGKRKRSVFNEWQLALVEAYCQRNRAMLFLLNNVQRLNPTSRRDPTNVETQSGIPSIYVGLLRVAMGTTSDQFALKFVSGSFLRTEESVGPDNDKKRKR
jgi:hypothetical protein